MTSTRLGGSSFVVAAVAFDHLIGEPPTPVHPVAWFGSGMHRLEDATYRPSIRAGALHWSIGVGGALAVGWCLRALLGRRLATTVAGTVAIAARMLVDEVTAVGDALERGDVEVARTHVAGLVGRDVTGLDVSGIARAAIETTAENGVDAVVATLWWGLVGGAPGVCVHRAVNTLDAMIGHRSERYERFGRVAAVADDIANWVPARLAVVATVLSRPHRSLPIARTIRRDAAVHPSPNGGLIEAAYAGALGVRLGGVNCYGDEVQDRGTLGDGADPEAHDVGRAVRLLHDVTLVT
ncbi:MAG: adenosylcobinamide-phosphate synthase CbiB, partial [Ilumatobacteraceae bacterium]